MGIERVQAAVVAEIDTLPPTLAGPCRRMATAGGKHLRARLVLHAAACAGSRSATRAADAAVAIELLHLATLVHDDLMDGAPSRRGVPTINAAEGPAMALLAGDALLGAAGRLAACVSADAAGLVQQSLIDLTFGQALEEASRFASGVDLTTTLRVAEGKTGTLMSAACMLGAQTAGDAPPGLVEALGAFGLAFGTSLQLIDDVLDLVSSAALYGKPTGVDFAAGTVTLPAVRALHRSEELRELLRPGLTDAQIRRALFLLRSSGGVADGVLWAQEHARRAAAALANAGPASLTAALRRMPHRFLDGQLALTVPSHRHLLQEVAHPSGMDMTTNVDSNVVRPPTGNGRAKVK